VSTTAGWRVPINLKLLAVLAVPVVGYLVIASAAVVRAQVHANRIRDQASVVSTAVGPTSLTTSLIDERTITVLEANGLQDDLTLRIGGLAEARQATDEQLTSLEGLVASNEEARATYTGAVEGLSAELDALRAEVDSGTADSTATFDRYGDFITSLLDANAAAVEDVSDAEFWQGAKLSELATRQKDARAVLVNALIPVSLNEGGLTDNDQAVAIIRALSAYENRDGAISELATGQYAQPGSVLVEALESADLAGLARTTLETNQLDRNRLFDVASYKGGFVYDAPTGDYIHDWFRAQVVEILDHNSGERMAAADRRLRDHSVGATVGLIITAVITFLVSRSIIRPLRSLTAQVIGTATDGLPTAVRQIQETPLGEDVPWPALPPVDVTTADEVGDVAGAFNTMQQSALDLAVEEAMLRRHITDSLVTLGQRNQSLLARQLTFITDLERNETDPDTLADLYYLDHLAVRMRRNAELLLVLAGVDPPRKWVGPTPMADVIRAALGEAAEYKRVRVHDVEMATIAGSATVELGHLLAELVENALVFSPPGDIVSISGHHRAGAGGADDYYVITVQDSGVGMTPDDMEQANRRLAAAESYSIAPSKYMGHYIAGKLAARHGIVARLHPNPAGVGVVATVGVPAHLLSGDAHADTVTQLPPLPPLPAHPSLPSLPAHSSRSSRSSGAEVDLPNTGEEPVMPLPPALPLEPLPALAPLPPLPPDDAAADHPDEPAASSARAVDPADVPTAEMVEIDLVDAYDDEDDDDYVDPSAPVPLHKQQNQQPQPRGRRKRALPSNRLPVPPSTQELSMPGDSDTAS
jgi:signal transduction histidine kinase